MRIHRVESQKIYPVSAEKCKPLELWVADYGRQIYGFKSTVSCRTASALDCAGKSNLALTACMSVECRWNPQ